MTTLQAKAILDQFNAIVREANEKYDLMDWALEQREWYAAFSLMEKGDNLMKLAARLEMRQAALVAAEGLPTVADEHAAINVAVRELMQ